MGKFGEGFNWANWCTNFKIIKILCYCVIYVYAIGIGHHQNSPTFPLQTYYL